MLSKETACGKIAVSDPCLSSSPVVWCIYRPFKVFICTNWPHISLSLSFILSFRYMRHWIETGHEKTFWKVPTLLKIAMDVLDDHLDDACCFHQALERGDMIFANNAIIAHARDQFKNDPDAPPRHKVRAWIQVQKAAILHDENSFATTDKNVSVNSNLAYR